MYEPLKRKPFKDKKTGKTYFYLYRTQEDLDKFDENAPRQMTEERKKEIGEELSKLFYQNT